MKRRIVDWNSAAIKPVVVLVRLVAARPAEEEQKAALPQ